MAINMPSDVSPSGKSTLQDFLHDFLEIIYLCNYLLCDTHFKAVTPTTNLQLLTPAQKEGVGSQSGLPQSTTIFSRNNSNYAAL